LKENNRCFARPRLSSADFHMCTQAAPFAFLALKSWVDR